MAKSPDNNSRRRVDRWLARGILTAALVCPVTSLGDLVGLDPEVIDAWPAWGLYSVSPARMKIFLPADALARVDQELLPYLGPPRFPDAARQLRIDRWALSVVEAPNYPDNRFRLGVALSVAERLDVLDQMEIVLESRADRWTGERTSRTLKGKDALQAEVARFRFNAQPRHAER